MEARAGLLARLNREKRLAEHTRSELATQGYTAPPDLEEMEANLRVRAIIHSRLATEKRAVLVHRIFILQFILIYGIKRPCHLERDETRFLNGRAEVSDSS